MHDAQIVQIADRIIKNNDVKLVLIAGPSSSGKTTFATRLTFQLAALGAHPLLISVDSYVHAFTSSSNDPTPVNMSYLVVHRYYKNWRECSDVSPSAVDWESLDTLNLEMLNSHLLKLFDGEVVVADSVCMCCPNLTVHWRCSKTGSTRARV